MNLGARSPRKYVDLHIHTKYSDGTCSVQEVVDMAAARGLRTISITDHDSVDAYPDACEAAAKQGMEAIPGVELSSEVQGVDIHILGYFLDVDNEPLRKKLHQMREARFERARKMVENLNRQGLDLRFETVLNIAGDAAIGRPHIAAAMLREELVYSFREAFDKYIGYDSPAYVEKLMMSPREVFELIRSAGGIPVLAHPGITAVDQRLGEFRRDGLLGIEVFHSEHPASVSQSYMRYAKTHNLAFTGGSDFHSASHNKSEIGAPRVPYSTVKSLADKLRELGLPAPEGE